MKNNIFLLICSISLINFTSSEEIFCTINGKKALNKVSDKFLSVSVDPETILTGGVDWSDKSLSLAKRVRPAYVRIAGPSTHLVSYSDTAPPANDHSPLVVTAPEWFGVNEWLRQAGLTPIFGLADSEEGAWRPEEALPLLQMTDRFNVSCLWQLGYDCSNKTETQYKEDLKTLRQVLNTFPEHKASWKIVGSDLSKCFPKPEKFENLKEMVKDLENDIEAVMWEPSEVATAFSKPTNRRTDSKIALWTSVSRREGSTGFNSLFSWIKQLQEAAKTGFEVVFTEASLVELSSTSPAYWFLLLHKKLMGNHILDTKFTNQQPQVPIYAHCTKNQNQFVRRGSVTVLAINNGTEKYLVNLKLGVAPTEKNMEVQSYVLTTSEDNSMNTCLNGETLTEDLDAVLKPKVNRVKVSKHISLEVPPKSVAFFVIPDARAPICDKNEDTKSDILEEIDQNEDLSINLQPRGSFTREDVLTLEKIKQRMEQALQYEEKKKNAIKRGKSEKSSDSIKSKEDRFQTARKWLLETSKSKDKNKIVPDLENKKVGIKNLMKQRSQTVEEKEDATSEDLSRSDVEDVLRQRIEKKGLEKNVQFTEDELVHLVDAAWEKYKKHRSKRAINRLLLDERYLLHRIKPHSQEIFDKKEDESYIKMQDNRMKRDINNNLLGVKAKIEEVKNKLRMKHERIKSRKSRFRRDINIDLLKKKTEAFKSKKESTTKKPRLKTLYKDKEEKMASIRRPGQTSEEILEELLASSEETNKTPKLPSEIFAEIASVSEEEGSVEEESPKGRKLDTKKIAIQPEGKKREEFKLQFLTSSQEIEDIEDDLPSIHEYYMPEKVDNKKNNKFRELWEIGIPRKSKKGRDDVETRDGFSSDEIEFSEEDLRRRKRNNGVTKEEYRKYKKYMTEQLKLMKKQMSEGKMKSRMKIEESEEDIKQIESLKAKLATKKEHVEKLLKEDTKLNNKFFKRYQEEIEDVPNKPVETIRQKRSIFDKDIFGKYKILNTWKTTLPENVPFSTRIASPYFKPNYKNAFGQNKFVTYRRRRNIDGDSTENEIDGSINEIHKDVPKYGFENRDYDVSATNRDRFEVNNNNVRKIEATTVTAIEESKTESLVNVQKIPPKDNGSESKFLESVLTGVTSFFGNFGKQLKSYWDTVWK